MKIVSLEEVLRAIASQIEYEFEVDYLPHLDQPEKIFKAAQLLATALNEARVRKDLRYPTWHYYNRRFEKPTFDPDGTFAHSAGVRLLDRAAGWDLEENFHTVFQAFIGDVTDEQQLQAMPVPEQSRTGNGEIWSTESDRELANDYGFVEESIVAFLESRSIRYDTEKLKRRPPVAGVAYPFADMLRPEGVQSTTLLNAFDLERFAPALHRWLKGGFEQSTQKDWLLDACMLTAEEREEKRRNKNKSPHPWDPVHVALLAYEACQKRRTPDGWISHGELLGQLIGRFSTNRHLADWNAIWLRCLPYLGQPVKRAAGSSVFHQG
jgi:hypothetical protein